MTKKLGSISLFDYDVDIQKVETAVKNCDFGNEFSKTNLFYSLMEKECKTPVEKLLLAINRSIDLYYLLEKMNTAELTSAKIIALDKREDITRSYFEEIKQRANDGKIKTEKDLLGAIRSKYGAKMRKKNLLNEIQRSSKQEYDILKKRADEDGKQINVLDQCIEQIPTPDRIVNGIIEREYIKKHGIDIEEYEMYNNLDFYEELDEYGELVNVDEYKKRIHNKPTKQKIFEIKTQIKQAYKKLGY